MALLFGFLIVAALIAAVTFHVAVAQNQVVLDRLDRQVSKAQRDYEIRMAEVAAASSPDRIRSRAMEMGLVEPDPGNSRYVDAPAPAIPAAPEAPPNSLASWEEVKDQIAGAP
jgi:cell division protein FtsL